MSAPRADPFSQLEESLELLAAPPEKQVQFLRDDGTYPLADELALTFDNRARASWQLAKDRTISPFAHKALLRLNNRLKMFSGPEYAEEWQASALATSTNWAEVRALARATLELIDREL